MEGAWLSIITNFCHHDDPRSINAGNAVSKIIGNLLGIGVFLKEVQRDNCWCKKAQQVVIPPVILHSRQYINKKMKNIPTLYEWSGGMQTFEMLFTKFYGKVLKDDLLGEVFRNMSAAHITHVAHFVAEVFGGDKLYTTEDGGSHTRMIGQHIGKMLTEEKRQRWVHLLIQTADEAGLKSDPEFRSAFVGYLEWGTRIAVINSQLTENPMVHDEPMPKWGWGETGGPFIQSDN